MSSYFESLDSAFLAHFSRRLSDLIIDQGTKLLESHGITTPTAAVSTIYFLKEKEKEKENVTVADLAKALDVTHQMATQRANTLESVGLILRQPNPQDKRAKTLHLTELGSAEANKLRPITRKVTQVFDQLNKQIECELMSKIRQAELALIDKPLAERLKEIEIS